MPRIPEVCPTAFCPHLLSIRSSFLRVLYAPYYYGPPICCLLFLFITYNSLIITAHAQSATATLSGTVMDQKGALIPGANVAVISTTQGFQRSAMTNDEGIFVIPLLPPGKYTVKAEHEGFSPAEVRDVDLNVNTQVTIKITMTVGNIANQTVNILGTPTLINESPAVGTIVDRKVIENMPLNGRSLQALIGTIPGVVTVPAAGNSGQFSVNGQRPNANSYTVDGVSANIGNGVGFIPGPATSGTLPGLTAFGGTNSLVSIDAVQEFQVQTSTYSAEYGRYPGAQISLVTRAGSNEFHGSLFEYFRNDVFDANDWFLNRQGLEKPAMRQSDFGGVLGGPILLPRFGEGGRQPWYNGKNKSFFFFSYEGLRLRTPQFAFTNVPSVNLRQTAPPQMRPFLNAFPLPNGRTLTNGFAEFSAGYSDKITLNATSVRFDHHTFNNRLTVFGRYNDAPSRTDKRDNASNLSNLILTEIRPRTLTTGATMVFTPSLTNELRANYSHNRGRFGVVGDSFGGATPISPELLLLPQVVPPGTSALGSVLIFFSGLTAPPGFTPLVTVNDVESSQHQFNLVDNFALTAGAHEFKFGVDYRRLTPTLSPPAYSLVLQFLSPQSLFSSTAQVTSISAGVRAKPIYNSFSAFAQDSWRYSHRLVLQLGLRWDLNPPPTEANGNDPPAVSGVTDLATLSLEPQGTPLWKTTYNNFGPRLGVAYLVSETPGRETSLRAGFGVFYDAGNSQGSVGFNHFPFNPNLRVANVSLPLSATQVAPPLFTRAPRYGEMATFDPNLKLPYTLQWNVAIEQSLGTNQSLSASYVAAAGRRLLVTQRFDLTAINPNFSTVRLTTNDSDSDYHSLQMQYKRRLSRGLQALASYTWAHAIDTASVDTFATANQVVRGNSSFDLRHNLAATVTYDVPGSVSKTAIGSLLRRWSIDTRFNAQSALPVDITAGTMIDPVTRRQLSRPPNLITGVPLYVDDTTVPGGRLINRAAFSIPPAGQLGSLGRNVLRGFPAWQVDLALRKQFNITDTLNMQLRAEAFNIFNHPNFGAIQNSLTASNFGQATNMLGRQLGGSFGGFNPLYQIGGPRSLQFALKFLF